MRPQPPTAPAETRRDLGPGPLPGTMRAVTHHRFGGPEVLGVEEVEVPRPGPGEVLVRVSAAGVDRGVWHLVGGHPYLIRLAGFGVRRPARPVPGMDLAGRVVAVGEGVADLAPGDEVMGVGTGAWAQYAVAPAAKLVRRPARLGVAEAAATPISGITAHQALHRYGELRSGERVLVLGASGGVGSFAVLLAVAAGARVTGVCSAAKADLVRRLGAEQVLDYAALDPAAADAAGGTGPYDLVVDIGGRAPLRRLRRTLTSRGRLVIVGGEGAGRVTGGVGRQVRGALLSPFLRQTIRMFVAGEAAENLRAVLEELAAADLRPAVERTYPLDEAPQALRDLQDGRVRGKAVLVLDPQEAAR